MLTTFDKYLLNKFLHTFVVFLVATYGLYIVIDLFTNMDDFQKAGEASEELGVGGGPIAVLMAIVRYYGVRVSEFFEMAGPILIVVSAIAVLGLLEKNSESHPILAAGIPAFRLLRPLLIGTGVLNLLLVINQELVMPNIVVALQTPRGGVSASAQEVEPVYGLSELHDAHRWQRDRDRRTQTGRRQLCTAQRTFPTGLCAEVRSRRVYAADGQTFIGLAPAESYRPVSRRHADGCRARADHCTQQRQKTSLSCRM